MTARIVSLAPIREARLEAELRERFGVEAEDTALPIGFLTTRLLDRTRVKMAERRNREVRR